MNTDITPFQVSQERDSHSASSSHDGWSDRTAEIYADLQQHFSGKKDDEVKMSGKVSQSEGEPQCYWDWAQKNFALIDTDNNGFVNAGEIDSGYHNPKIPEDQHYGLNGLRTFYQNIQKASNDEWFVENDGITRADLDAYKSDQLARNWRAERARRSEVDE